MFSRAVRDKLIDGLEGTPELVAYLVEDIPDGDPLWDNHPDPSGYSLRSIIAHLADWDSIWLERLKLTATGSEPILTAVFLNKRAEEKGYAISNPCSTLEELFLSRPKITSVLRELRDAEWKRFAFHPEEGKQSIETQCAWILAHDDYYIKQIARWMRSRK